MGLESGYKAEKRRNEHAYLGVQGREQGLELYRINFTVSILKKEGNRGGE